VPLSAETLARLASDRRTLHEPRAQAGSWIANSVLLEPEQSIGVLAARLPASADAAGDESKILQVAAGWLGRELGRARMLREHTELVATIGRDLKKPLGAALGHSQALLRGLHGTLTDAERWTVLEIERSVHRVILSALEILDYERVTRRGFEVARQRFSPGSIVDHVLSRQSAAIELAGVTVRSEIPADLPMCIGDLARADRAVAIVVHELLARLGETREIAMRADCEADDVRLDIEARVRDAAPFLETFGAAVAPPELGETMALRLARGWVEAQGGRVTVLSATPALRIRFSFPRAAD
jgi:signal transduction histidine kinase